MSQQFTSMPQPALTALSPPHHPVATNAVPPPTPLPSQQTSDIATAPEDTTPVDHLRQRISVPEFDGDSDIQSFFIRFEICCKALGCRDPFVKKATLLGNLTGMAMAWTQGRRQELEDITYEELKAELCLHFEGETMGHVR
jgi:hypothetical protein